MESEKEMLVDVIEVYDTENHGFVPSRLGCRHNKRQGRPCLARFLRKGLCAFVITGLAIYYFGLPYSMTSLPC
jgi:endothelin-converting enzyme